MITIPLNNSIYRVGVISDTHGLLRSEAIQALQGVDLILHAGDVGRPDVIEALRSIAPVIAVRGNMDQGGFGLSLPQTESIQIGTHSVYLLHDIARFYGSPADGCCDLIVSGHTHRPDIGRDGRITFLNPGSAGPARHSLPVTLAIIEFKDGDYTIRHLDLES